MQLHSKKEYLADKCSDESLCKQPSLINKTDIHQRCQGSEGHRNQWLLIVKQREHPLKEENLKSPWTAFLSTLPQYDVEHTRTVYHIHTQRFVLTNRLKKTNTFSLHNISQVCALNKDREKKDTRKGKCILKSEPHERNLTAFLYFTSLLTKLLSSKLAKQEL